MTTKGKVGAAAGVVVALVIGSAVKDYYTLLGASRRVVETIAEEGHLTERSCSPNEAAIKSKSWNSLARRRQDTLVKSLALICQAEGKGFSMTLIADETGNMLARYDDDYGDFVERP